MKKISEAKIRKLPTTSGLLFRDEIQDKSLFNVKDLKKSVGKKFSQDFVAKCQPWKSRHFFREKSVIHILRGFSSKLN